MIVDDLIETVGKVLGTPYESGSMGPNTFDCWGLFRHIQIEVFKRDTQVIVPPPPDNIRALVKFVQNHDEHKNWNVSDKPEHGGVVEMSHANHPHHVGVWLDIDGGGVLHCSVAGVTFDSLFVLKASGWRKFIYYTYVQKND